MVSFSCENCGDVLTKKKLDPHRNRCRGATFTCIDCMVHFYGTDYRAHTSCITEDQKYQGALYKNKKAKTNNKQSNETAVNSATTPNAAQSAPDHIMTNQPYAEEISEAFADGEYEDVSDSGNARANLPEAPSPPPIGEGHVNVFDFLDPAATPNASTLQLAPADHGPPNGETQLVRYDASEAQAHQDDESGQMIDDNPQAMVQYGTDPAATGPFQTPAPRTERRKTGSELKKDKKRKRLHLDTDQIMADAPPVLHSGLTGGLNRMMAPVFPPSPDYSGGDAADPSPSGALKKKKKQSKSKTSSKRESSLGSNLLALMGAGGSSTKSKTKKRKVSSSSRKASAQHRSSDREKAPKLIEYRPHSRSDDKDGDADRQMVVYRPRADLLLSYVDKGPESERGYSMRKALRQYHRERNASSDCLGKATEEKELWRSLRMRKNDRGEIVLFGLGG
ncbi:hypothetical protein ACRALDRAFT_2042437 [Sodiomyces alcalophilus JCM 7366]|uniref:uncharacterized protein n=1 Tax=Sodiomyces alcalophilus JCM 7366 TaxID=591952 RepID=UPI0039B66783